MDTPAFLGYHANGQKGLEGAAKRRLKHPGSRYKKVQHSAVLFFVSQTLKPYPEGVRHYCDSHRKLAFKVAVVVMDAVSEANDGLRVPQTKTA